MARCGEQRWSDGLCCCGVGKHVTMSTRNLHTCAAPSPGPRPPAARHAPLAVHNHVSMPRTCATTCTCNVEHLATEARKAT